MELSERATLITSTTESTGVNIATWFLATTFLVMYSSRQIVKFVMLRKIQLDDVLMTAAMLFGVGLSLAFSIAADNGLGNESINQNAFQKIQKAYYAADLLFIITLCFVKLTLVVFFNNISADQFQKRIIMTLGVFCVAASVCMLFAAAFQCGVSRAWEVMTLHCFDQTAFWIAFGVIDMMTDIGLILLSLMLVWDLRIPISRKVVVVGCFAPRMLVVVAAAARLAYLAPINSHENPAFRIWISVVCTELQICLSISTACIPCIKPFFEGVEVCTCGNT
ncbi:hypothetical protein BKA66DRAFT_435277 [Pyrenochaeta sp. MPI-SDFR-AT-0127]|nr:hypothetical protein BKA66DRAFT_435277 [Pyrenochaeta sp. MPI-SDFR-AT-0127]